MPSTQARASLACTALLAACAAPVSAPVVAPHAAPAVAVAGPPARTTPSTHATLKLDASWSRCHEGFTVGSDDASAEVARLAAGCAQVTKMHRVADPFVATQSASDRPQTYRWKGVAGHCYRAYGAGVRAIKNLDLLLLDSNGAALAQDGTDDGAPVALDVGAVCFKDDDDASLIVSVGDGSGAYAVEIWGD